MYESILNRVEAYERCTAVAGKVMCYYGQHRTIICLAPDLQMNRAVKTRLAR